MEANDLIAFHPIKHSHLQSKITSGECDEKNEFLILKVSYF